MQDERGHFRPWIWRRLLLIVLLGALIPLSLMAYLTTTAPSGSLTGDMNLRAMIDAESGAQFARLTKAEAGLISQRLGRIEYGVHLLAGYAEEVLSAPQVFATVVAPQLQNSEESNEPNDGSDESGTSDSAVTPPLGNPLFYTQGDDGAIRKLIDDGRPSVYFAARSGGFSTYDWQRVHASTTLDALLIKQVSADPLCSQSFLITRDNLIRTYPFIDFSMWSPDVDMAKPRDFWSSIKANETGVLWTNPYFSTLTDGWVITCMTAIEVSGRMLGVVGCEVSLQNLGRELLSFSLGSEGMAWLIKPQPTTDDSAAVWLVLAAQTGGKGQLGVIPMEAAEVPTEKHTGMHILAEADLALHGPDNISTWLSGELAGRSNDNSAQGSKPVSVAEDGRYLALHSIGNSGWVLCGTIRSQATVAVGSFETELQGWQGRQFGYIIGVFVFGLTLAFVLALLEARRITEPLAILTQQIRQVARTGRISAVVIADEGEIGSLADAVQELIDFATGKDQHVAEERDEDVPAEFTQREE